MTMFYIVKPIENVGYEYLSSLFPYTFSQETDPKKVYSYLTEGVAFNIANQLNAYVTTTPPNS